MQIMAQWQSVCSQPRTSALVALAVPKAKEKPDERERALELPFAPEVVIQEERPDQRILRVARDLSADIIAMRARGGRSESFWLYCS
jgi:nucleotide-binding universal stress UspA family protein